MTFVIAMTSPAAVIVAADRRYTGVASVADYRGTKMCRLLTDDAHGIIAYAGAGIRVNPPPGEPLELSLWIERLLQGSIRTFDQSMNMISVAATQQRLRGYDPNHSFMFAGFLDGRPIIETLTAAKMSGEIENAKTASANHFVRLRFPPGGGVKPNCPPLGHRPVKDTAPLPGDNRSVAVDIDADFGVRLRAFPCDDVVTVTPKLCKQARPASIG
jgi:hypothetical protein